MTVPAVTYDDSCNQTAFTQTAMDACAVSELHQVEEQLQVATRIEAKAFPGLADAARSTFEAYEEAECRTEAAPNTGGTIYPLVFTDCELRLTIQRLQAVKEYVRSLPR